MKLRVRPNWVPLADWEKDGHVDPPIHVVPDQEKCDRFMESDNRGVEVPQRLQYIKLHGSMNWRKREGSSVMVIAGRKREQIESVPLLNWYLNKFQDVLDNDEIHLCLIGYGFGDPYINELLAEAINKKGLVLSIIYPGTKDQIDENIHTRGRQLEKEGEVDFSDTLIKGLSRGKLFDFDLRQAYPNRSSGETFQARLLRTTFGPS